MTKVKRTKEITKKNLVAVAGEKGRAVAAAVEKGRARGVARAAVGPQLLLLRVPNLSHVLILKIKRVDLARLQNAVKQTRNRLSMSKAAQKRRRNPRKRQTPPKASS